MRMIKPVNGGGGAGDGFGRMADVKSQGNLDQGGRAAGDEEPPGISDRTAGTRMMTRQRLADPATGGNSSNTKNSPLWSIHANAAYPSDLGFASFQTVRFGLNGRIVTVGDRGTTERLANLRKRRLNATYRKGRGRVAQTR